MFTLRLCTNPLRWPATMLAVLLTLGSGLAASEPSWFARTWQTDEGLPDNAVVGVAQTPDGFLWVATQGGLVRFDGNQFRNFTPVTEIGMPTGLLHGILADQSGKLRIVKDGGVLVTLDRGITTTLILTNSSSNARGITPVEDRDGALWLAYPSSQVRAVRIRDGLVREYGPGDGIPPGRPLLLTADTKKTLWWCVAGHIGVFRDERFVEHIEVEGVQCITAARDQGVWIGAGPKLYHFDEANGLKPAAELPSHRNPIVVTAMHEDRSGILWVGTSEQGLFRRGREAMLPAPVSHHEILSLAEDREGSLWVGTRGGGLNRIRPSVVEAREIESGIPFEGIRSVCQTADGTLWAVGRSGVVAQRAGTNWTILSADLGWPIRDAMSVAAHPTRGVWIGTHYDGLFLWDHGIRKNYTVKDGLSGNFARSLLSAPNGDLWIGTASAEGLHRLRTDALSKYPLPPGSGLVRAMTLDSHGTLWAGTAGGSLVRVTGDQLFDESDKSVARAQTIRCLHAAQDGSLWIGYGGGGAGRLKEGRFIPFRGEQGNLDDYISQVMDDAEGRLWFAGNKGIFYVRRSELEDQAAGRTLRTHPVVFGRDDGLPALQASREASPGILLGNDHSLWIAMQTGLAVVHPQALETNSVPPVVIESISLDGREVAAYDAATAKSGASKAAGIPMNLQHHTGQILEVPPGVEQIAITFTAMSFASPRNVGFRYQLEGLETGWSDAGSRREAIYTHLPAGSYRFKVTAADHSGIWNAAGASLRLTIHPRFWQTLWFQTGAVLGLMGLVAILVRRFSLRKLQREMERAEREKAIERERARIAKDIHDDLGASLTEITLLSELAQSGEGSPDEIQADMQRIAARTRHLTRALDTTVWAVNPRNDTVESLITYTCNHTTEYLQSAGIRCRLDISDPVPACAVSAAVRHNVFLIAKEALHNIVKHARASEVILRIRVQPHELAMSIQDDGHGFQRGDETSLPRTAGAAQGGNGIANMHRRAEELGGRLSIQSRLNEGTSLHLSIPLDPH